MTRPDIEVIKARTESWARSKSDWPWVEHARTDLDALLAYIEELEAAMRQCGVCGAMPGEGHGAEHQLLKVERARAH